MPRGGKRKGSGRKPGLPFWIKLRVGAFCEDCHQEETKRQAENRHEARRDIKAIRRAQEQPRQIRERVQKRFSAPDWRRQLRNLFDSKMERPLNRLGHVSAQIEKLGRYRSAPLKRPKGVRSKILKAATEKFRTIDYEGKKYRITVDVADKCWKIFREHERRLISSRNSSEASPK